MVAARGRRRPSQSDVARVAGVSQTTVSLVLSGNKSGVSLAETTRDRVLAAAEELGYTPDPVATRLALARNNILGLFTYTATFPVGVEHSYYPSLAGVEAEAAAQGQDLLLFTGARPGQEDIARRVRLADGCLFLGRHVPPPLLAGLLAEEYPFVHIGRRDELEGRIPYVGADYAPAATRVVRELRALGHREIRYVRERDEAQASADREAGVRRAGVPVLRTDGPAVTPDRVAAWLAEGVTAFVTEETDTGAVFTALTRALDTLGVDCPGRVSLAHLGAPPVTGWRDRLVSGFAVPRHEMARDAVRLLLDRVAGAHELPHQSLLPCPPVAGDTTGPAPLH
ncbi:DNA-binding LacI/PurR family transcriptional regulator [Crossiella equi]|uniref:DNA-binding LacI/PurR family transcriptional regulator n=1 Tax=Crossiella equi TaxID=130796 RepID=A0ABS5ASE4_9PSEU|nr:LacI family DNA-binding transcriptional regulator [Crossiella equi]MBP2479488.1 DNA-binding LacI/PurR family transcriptional regulator [Crossiella equi]